MAFEVIARSGQTGAVAEVEAEAVAITSEQPIGFDIVGIDADAAMGALGGETFDVIATTHQEERLTIDCQIAGAAFGNLAQ